LDVSRVDRIDMQIVSLNSISSLSEGAPFWFIHPRAKSAWTRKIDWLINFQLARATLWQRPTISTFLKEELADRESEFEVKSFDNSSDLIVSVKAFLPAKAIIQIDIDDSSKWLERVDEVSSQIGANIYRVFPKDSDDPLELKARIAKSIKFASEVSLVAPLDGQDTRKAKS